MATTIDAHARALALVEQAQEVLDAELRGPEEDSDPATPCSFGVMTRVEGQRSVFKATYDLLGPAARAQRSTAA